MARSERQLFREREQRTLKTVGEGEKHVALSAVLPETVHSTSNSARPRDGAETAVRADVGGAGVSIGAARLRGRSFGVRGLRGPDRGGRGLRTADGRRGSV